MSQSEIKGEQNIEKIIDKLRSQLNEAYEKDGLTEEVVKISQELDKYIVLAQRELGEEEEMEV
ncbi:MAG: aspartyl-phosphate phosphatase Spo0E family protein [Clostridia bacterium]|nr:aspartyl-phosphate phosphatase Spo0E family protein [Clostridia bacterium]